MSWEKYDKGVSINIKKDGTYSFRLYRRNKIKNENEYMIVYPPEGYTKNQVRSWVCEQRLLFEKELQFSKGAFKPKITFSEYFENVYLKKQLNIKPKTRSEYLKLYNNHIKKRIGNLALVEINSIVLSSMQNEMKNDGVGNSTSHHVHTLMKLVLQYAYEDGIIMANPAKNRGVSPKLEKKQQTVLNNNGMITFLEQADKEELIWKALAYVIVYTAGRRGEVAALTWDDVIMEGDDKFINYNKSVSVVNGRVECIGTTKSETSNRIIPIEDPLVGILAEYKRETGGDRICIQKFQRS